MPDVFCRLCGWRKVGTAWSEIGRVLLLDAHYRSLHPRVAAQEVTDA